MRPLLRRLCRHKVFLSTYHLYLKFRRFPCLLMMESATCTAPDGSAVWTFGLSSRNFAILAALVLGFFPFFVLLVGPSLVAYVGLWIGKSLRKKSEGRRAHILEAVASDQAAWEKENSAAQRRKSEEWEKIEGGDAKAGIPGGTGDDFDGIIGFFHPFWFVYVRLARREY